MSKKKTDKTYFKNYKIAIEFVPCEGKWDEEIRSTNVRRVVSEVYRKPPER